MSLLYTETDLVAFGNYLLSKERKKNTSKTNRTNVTDSDLSSWKNKEANKEFNIEKSEMYIDSMNLSDEEIEKYRNQLIEHIIELNEKEKRNKENNLSSVLEKYTNYINRAKDSLYIMQEEVIKIKSLIEEISSQ